MTTDRCYDLVSVNVVLWTFIKVPRLTSAYNRRGHKCRTPEERGGEGIQSHSYVAIHNLNNAYLYFTEAVTSKHIRSVCL